MAKGAQVIEFDMRDAPPSRAELMKAVLGPTGNLRAPAVRKGKMVIIGFNARAYEQLLK